MNHTDTRTLKVERTTSTGHRLNEYDGACGNIHGHNMRWEVEATVEMDDADASNMPVDLKDIADVIDEVDHATILNIHDDFVYVLKEVMSTLDNADDARNLIEEGFGDVIWFEHKNNGDPTCEAVAQMMARRIFTRFDPVLYVNITVYETDKYGIEATWNRTHELQYQDND